MVERVIIGDSFILHEVPGRETYRDESECPDHQVAIDLIIRTLTDPAHGVLKDINQISAIGHRVVHGGEKFTCSVMIDEHVLDAVKEVQHLAPLHNPPNIAGIEAAQSLLPNVPHVAIFDTAFHQTMPEHAYLYPVPYEWYETSRRSSLRFSRDFASLRFETGGGLIGQGHQGLKYYNHAYR